MVSFIPLTSKAAIYIASWLESGWQNESDAPDECADPAVDIGNELSALGTADKSPVVIVCSADEANRLKTLVATDLPQDPIDLLAIASARAYALMGATNALDGVSNTTRSNSFHSAANTLIDALQLELGRQAGLCDSNSYQKSDLAEALYAGSANSAQCLEAAKIAKERRDLQPPATPEDNIDMNLRRGELTDLIEAVSSMKHQDPSTQEDLLAKLNHAASLIDEEHIS